jgi:hypothetical protein
MFRFEGDWRKSGEEMWMSAKKRHQLMLPEVKKRHISQKHAAAELGLSVRWVRKLLLRWVSARTSLTTPHEHRQRQ